MAALSFTLHAAGVLAPGLSDLAQLRAVSRGEQTWVDAPLELPGPSQLPSNERRRASQVVRLALACIAQVVDGAPWSDIPLRSVFATDEGTGEVSQQMLQALSTTRQVSPLLFTNSVHNAPSGYFSIAWRNTQPATVVSLGLDSFACGLVCAVTQAMATAEPVLLVSYDCAMTPPMDEVLGVRQSTATAWIISTPGSGARAPALASFTLELEPAGAHQPSPQPDWLPAAWSGHSSARGLAALGLLDAALGAAQAMRYGAQMMTLTRAPEATA